MSTNRRTFLKNSTLLGGGLIVGHKSTTQSAKSSVKATNLKIFATNWGFPGDLETFCLKASETGYDGIEVWMPGKESERKALKELTGRHELELALLTGGFADTFEDHYRQFQQNLETAVSMKPSFVNCHAGKDFFRISQNKQIIEFTINTARTSGIPIYHETHRGRMLFNAPLTRQYLEEMPALELTLDISHWCCVHESLLQNQSETVEKALLATGHIHARVGHAEGPQITAIDAPEWKQTLDAHLNWWDAVVARREAEGKVVTITPEFGPPHYMPTIPYTGQALADNWKVNARMLEICRGRYGTKG